MYRFIMAVMIGSIVLAAAVSAQTSEERQKLIIGPSYYGLATLNGENVPVNSVIIAKIDGKTLGDFDGHPLGQITVDVAGQYGVESGDSKLSVPNGYVGATIEFFLKMPGYHEIKAAETDAWSQSQIIELDLTFEGTLTAEPEPPITSSGGSSGGGGGGSGGGGGGAPSAGTGNAKQSFFVDAVIADDQKMITLKESDLAFIRLQIIVTNTVAQVTFAFEELDAPTEPVDNVYQYVKITADKILDDNVQIAVLKFVVPKAWFTDNDYDPQKVTLLRFHDGAWQRLTTVYEGSDAAGHQYRAGTPGFSEFAIQAEKLPERMNDVSFDGEEPVDVDTSDEDGKVEDESSETDDAQNEITGNVVADNQNKSPLVAVAIVAIAVLVLGGLYVGKKRKRVGAQ